MLFNKSNIENEIGNIMCENCGNPIEVGYQVCWDIEEVFKEYGEEGLFGYDGYLSTPPEYECGTCYFCFTLSDKNFEMLKTETKKLISKRKKM